MTPNRHLLGGRRTFNDREYIKSLNFSLSSSASPIPFTFNDSYYIASCSC